MTLQFVRDRLTSLRMKKGISEAEMSRALGHSKGYMQAISSGRRMMPLEEFLTILDYLGVTPSEFFVENPADMMREVQIRKMNNYFRTLPVEVLDLLAEAAEERVKHLKNQ
ncbi:MAG: helix-turn-helix transcriptional regulator [Lachnospiraceae bacterium]|nr:helix-turn-helix transcriptional regulator [Lachnospiraceae bacterium]